MAANIPEFLMPDTEVPVKYHGVEVQYTHSLVLGTYLVQYNDSHRCVWVGSFISTELQWQLGQLGL